MDAEEIGDLERQFENVECRDIIGPDGQAERICFVSGLLSSFPLKPPPKRVKELIKQTQKVLPQGGASNAR